MDKSCRYTKDDIWDYYSGKLSRKKETEMQEHIIVCDSCQKELEKLECLDQIVSGEIPPIEENRKINRTQLVISIIAIAAAVTLIVYLILPKKEISYPIDKDRQDVFGPGDSSKVDSSYIKSKKIDTLQMDSPHIE